MGKALAEKVKDFYPRSPCGERPNGTVKKAAGEVFLSTLSLRRATAIDLYTGNAVLISIHALLAESDHVFAGHVQATVQFLSTLSLRRATHRGSNHGQQCPISIHALLAESDAILML